MKFKIINDYKSFKKDNNIDFDLPNFMVLTGENGSGKTQFIESIFSQNIVLFDEEQQIIVNDGDMIKINYMDIQNNTTSNYSLSQYTQIVNTISRNINDNRSYSNEPIHIGNKGYSNKEIVDRIKQSYPNSTITIRMINEWLVSNGFLTSPFDVNLLASKFFNYNMLLVQNVMDQMNEKDSSLSQDEFLNKYGDCPWNILNSIIHDTLNLKIKVCKVDLENMSDNYSLEFINDDGDKFGLNDLSSGEKVLICIAQTLFSEETGQLKKPKILLLDEVDCSLHPSMIKKLVMLLNEIFVTKYGIKVILTTHSPTTVALVEEESLYYMQTDKDKRIMKKSKNEILSLLAYGLQTLSVTYEDRRFVLVESNYDVYSYEKAYMCLKNNLYLKNKINIIFISSGSVNSANTGSCENVKEIVSKFNDSKIYGILDWDKHNLCRDNVLVLGQDKCYAIENCIFNPVALLLYFLNEKDLCFDVSTLGLKNTFDIFRNFNEFADNIQTLVDKFLDLMKNELQYSGNDGDELITFSFVNQTEINIPKWYLWYNGHELEDKLKDKFSFLKRHNNANALSNSILRMLERYPGYVPSVFKNVFDIIIDKQNND